MGSAFPSVDVNHIAAARDVANEQDDEETKQENGRARASEAEVEVSMNKIEPDADQKYAPAWAPRRWTKAKSPSGNIHARAQRPPSGLVAKSTPIHAAT